MPLTTTSPDRRHLRLPTRNYAGNGTLYSVGVRLDLAPRGAVSDRAAVRAHTRVRRPAQLLEDVTHLLHGERIVCLDGGVAGHRRGNLPESILDARAAVQPLDVLGQGAHGSLALRWI